MELYLALFISAAVAFAVTPATIWLVTKLRILDNPSRIHPAILHRKPIPRSGGIAVYVAIISAYLALAFFFDTDAIDKHILGLLLAGLIVVSVGVLDDKFDLNPYLRLGTNLCAAAVVVGFGVGISWITNPFGGQIRLDEIILHFNFPAILPFDFFAGPHTIVLLADIVAFIWIVWIMNSLNWSSGVDGQLSGILVVVLLALGLAAQRLWLVDPAQHPSAYLSFISAGAFLGFLPWSFYPQKIMPGYGGATLGGLMVASLAILSGAKLATVILLLIVPMIDAVWAIVRRILRHQSPVWGDREHLHHRLLALGWKPWQIAVFYYSIGAVFALLALSLDHRGRFFAISLGGVLILAFLVTFAYFSRKLVKKNV
jgi:UDP-GlcNAc:undecaprenyl-phosphate GlcNAc-1-phosphate transferase